MLNVNFDELIELREYVSEQLENTGQHIPTAELATVLLDYADKFDISAMLRFKNWMLENGYHDDEVLATIVHDLNGRNDVCFLPRTGGY